MYFNNSFLKGHLKVLVPLATCVNSSNYGAWGCAENIYKVDKINIA